MRIISIFSSPSVATSVARSSFLVALLLTAVSCSSLPPPPEEIFETRNTAAGYLTLADSLVRKGQYESAAKFYRQAIDANASVDSLAGVSTARSSLGRLWLAWGDYVSAADEFAKASQWALMSGSPRAMALAATGRGELAFRSGDIAAALAAFDEAVKAASGGDQTGKTVADEASLGIALHDRAGSLYALGKTAEARADLERSLAINTKLKRWSEIAANRYLLASFFVKEGRAAEAMAAAKEALVNDKKAENSPGVTGDLLLLARLAGETGNEEEAYWYWRRAFEAGLGTNLPSLARKALEGLIGISPKVGREAEVAGWQASLDKLASIGAPK
jgi:tetratricopeptide (TPR) repeat protein